MKTYYCPHEHQCHVLTYGNIYCPTCQQKGPGGWWANRKALLQARGSVEDDELEFSGRLEGTPHSEGTYTGVYYTEWNGATWYRIDPGDGYFFDTTDEPPPEIIELPLKRIATFAEWLLDNDDQT